MSPVPIRPAGEAVDRVIVDKHHADDAECACD